MLHHTAGVPSVNTFRSGIDFLGTVRGRLGYAFNTFLIYGTGGFAYGDVFNKAALYTAGNPNQLRFYGSKSGIQTGYTYGGGIEYALPTGSFLNFFKSSAVTLKARIPALRPRRSRTSSRPAACTTRAPTTSASRTRATSPAWA